MYTLHWLTLTHRYLLVYENQSQRLEYKTSTWSTQRLLLVYCVTQPRDLNPHSFGFRPVNGTRKGGCRTHDIFEDHGGFRL